jgi:hypothetical protein
LTVRAINLNHEDLVIVKETGKTDTPRTGALNTDTVDLTIRREPPEQRFTSGMIRWEWLDSQHTTIGIDHSRYMGIGVGIHTTNNHPYHWHGRPFSAR